MKKHLGVVAATLVLAGCGGDESGGSGAPQGVLTIQQAEVAADRLGRDMAPLVIAADEQVALGGSLEEKRAVFAELFGAAVPKTIEEDGSLVFDGRFRLGAGSDVDAETIDGRPTLITWSLTGGAAFFYEPTVLDVGTGAVYQGSYMDAGPEEIEFFGPLDPALAAQVVGSFAQEELFRIDSSLRTGLSSEMFGEETGQPE